MAPGSQHESQARHCGKAGSGEHEFLTAAIYNVRYVWLLGSGFPANSLKITSHALLIGANGGGGASFETVGAGGKYRQCFSTRTS